MSAVPDVVVPSRKRTARLFHALADETRLRILDQLAHGEQCVCDLSGALEARQSRLSFHLKTLKDAGLVTDHRESRWIYYALNPEALAELRDAVNVFGLPPDRTLRIVPRRCE